jgi:hypothetical protein
MRVSSLLVHSLPRARPVSMGFAETAFRRKILDSWRTKRLINPEVIDEVNRTLDERKARCVLLISFSLQSCLAMLGTLAHRLCMSVLVVRPCRASVFLGLEVRRDVIERVSTQGSVSQRQGFTCKARSV